MVIKTKCAFRSNFFIDGLFVDFFFFLVGERKVRNLDIEVD